MTSLFIFFQKLIPKHLVSRMAGKLADSKSPTIRKILIRIFQKVYSVSLKDALFQNAEDYDSFNAFFTRALSPIARPICIEENTIVSPVDGTISETGTIHEGAIIQAKGHKYSLASLLGEDPTQFEGGSFLTIYLAPNNYHRIHAPLPCTLTKTTAIPGQLFSVNARTESAVPNIFSRNERLVCQFDTGCGQMALIMVGALLVGRIETVWSAPSSPYQKVQRKNHTESFEKGAELGRFLLGSTVILCYQARRVSLDLELQAGTLVQVGQKIGKVN